MGALHSGHESLIQRAVTETDFVVVSIFVNPLQFGKNEDLDQYPRPLEQDKAICKQLGVKLLFTPSVTEIYPSEEETTIVNPHCYDFGFVWKISSRAFSGSGYYRH